MSLYFVLAFCFSSLLKRCLSEPFAHREVFLEQLQEKHLAMSAATPLQEEDEFDGRDASGLEPNTEKTPTEEAETAKYAKMLLVVVPLIGQTLAWSTYFVAAYLAGQKEIYASKFAFISEHQLGYVFLAVWIIGMARSVNVVNANGARGPARVGRPDQHAYKIMACSGPLKDAPYVMMAGTGPQGRFNRAQRGVFNGDEAMPLMLAWTVLAGSALGPVVLVPVLLASYGRITFGKKYKESLKGRSAGFLPAMVGERWVEGLVLLCAIKGIFKIPF